MKKRAIYQKDRKIQLSVKTSLLLISLFIFLFTFIIYIKTSFPSLSPIGDGAELVTNSYLLGINHPPGYPLYSLIGHIFISLPLGNIPFRMNFMSCLFSSLSSVLLFLTGYLLFKNKISAVIMALCYSFSYTFWKLSLCTEVFILNVFLALSTIFILILWRDMVTDGRKADYLLYIFSFFCGLGLSHHHTIVLLFPAFFYLIIVTEGKNLSCKKILFSFVFLLSGLLPYFYIPLRAGSSPMNWGAIDMDGFIGLITRRGYGSLSLNVSGSNSSFISNFIYNMKVYLVSLYRQFSPLIVPLFFSGLFVSFKKKRIFFFFFILIFIFSGPFFLALANPSSEEGWKWLIERFYLLSFISLTVFTGFSFDSVKMRFSPVYYFLLLFPLIPIIYNYPRVNNSNNYIYYDYSKNLLNSLPEKAILICRSDLCGMGVMYFQKVEGFRRDVRVLQYGLLCSQWYNKQMRNIYPQVLPEKILSSNDEMVKMIIDKANSPVFTDIPYSSDLRCSGLIYEFYKDSADPEEILSLLNNLSFRNRLKAEFYNEYFTSEIIRFYSLAYYDVGKEFLKDSRYRQAEEVFKKSLDIYELPQVYNSLGFICFIQGDYKRAEEFYNKALSFKEDSPEIYYNLGLLYKKKGELNKAENFFLKIIELSENDYEAYFNLALIYMEESDFLKAEEKFNKCIKIDPDNPAPYSNLGIIYAKQSNIDSAINLFETALRVDPSIPDIHYNLAIMLLKKGMWKEAEIKFKDALRAGYPEKEIKDKLEFINNQFKVWKDSDITL